MKQTNIEHLEWIYNRMLNVYNEDKDFDYMLKFRSILDELKSQNSKFQMNEHCWLKIVKGY
jgi:hypothetical protein